MKDEPKRCSSEADVDCGDVEAAVEGDVDKSSA